jgi:transcription factor C subunit 6
VQLQTKACIQIWTLEPTRRTDAMDDDQDDYGVMKCAMVLCLEGGPAHDLKWCPLPSHDPVRSIYFIENVHENGLSLCLQITDAEDQTGPRKLGLLAGTFEDGSLSIYAVPEPLDVSPQDLDSSPPVFGMSPFLLDVRILAMSTPCSQAF